MNHSFLKTCQLHLLIVYNHFLIFCRSGGTGRRAGLKIQYGQPCVGSSPTSGTTKCNNLLILLQRQLFWDSLDTYRCIVIGRIRLTGKIFAQCRL